MKKQPSEELKFVRGPSVSPGFKMGAWFENQIMIGDTRQARVPLVLKRGQVGYSLRGARIGAAADAMEVYAHDSALGIGLDNRARTHCKDRPTCAFWVEGRMAREESGEFRFDVLKVTSPIAPEALAAANFIEIEDRSLPAPAQPVEGLPLPEGARKNESMGGATTLAPGRNYRTMVYDIELDTGTITAFYERHLPEAQRATEDSAVIFSTPKGKVKVSRFSKGTRITLILGPQ